MAINLADIQINPSDRPGVMEGVNKSNKNLVESAQERQARVTGNQRLINEISSDVEKKKAVYQQQTAKTLEEMTGGYNVEMQQASNQFLRQSALLRSQDQELAALKAQSENPNLPGSERRKAQKQYDELNEEAYTTQQRRNNLAKNVQNLAVARETIAKDYLAQRKNQQQANFDIESYTQMVRLENLNKTYNVEQEFENVQGQYVNQMRTLGASEAEALKQENSGMLEFMWAVTNDFDEEAMANFDKNARTSMSGQLQMLGARAQQDLAPLIGTWERMKQDGEQPTKQDLVGLVIKSGRLGTLKQVADLSGDEQLQDAIERGRQPYMEAVTERLTTQFEEERGMAPSPQDMKNIQQQAAQTVNDGYARDIIDASVADTMETAAQQATGAGQAIYSPEHLEDSLDPNAYSPQAMEVVRSEDFKNAIAQVGSDSGDEILSASERAIQVMQDSGVNEEESFRIMADINKKSAKSHLRNRDSRTSSDLDYFNSMGFVSDAGLLSSQLPNNVRRIATRNQDVKVQPIYDYGEASDLMAAMEVIRSYRKYMDNRAARNRAGSPAGRTQSINEALRGFQAPSRSERPTIGEAFSSGRNQLPNQNQ